MSDQWMTGQQWAVCWVLVLCVGTFAYHEWLARR